MNEVILQDSLNDNANQTATGNRCIAFDTDWSLSSRVLVSVGPLQHRQPSRRSLLPFPVSRSVPCFEAE
jgi:hypothetical protein